MGKPRVLGHDSGPQAGNHPAAGTLGRELQRERPAHYALRWTAGDWRSRRGSVHKQRPGNLLRRKPGPLVCPQWLPMGCWVRQEGWVSGGVGGPVSEAQGRQEAGLGLHFVKSPLAALGRGHGGMGD